MAIPSQRCRTGSSGKRKPHTPITCLAIPADFLKTVTVRVHPLLQYSRPGFYPHQSNRALLPPLSLRSRHPLIGFIPPVRLEIRPQARFDEFKHEPLLKTRLHAMNRSGRQYANGQCVARRQEQKTHSPILPVPPVFSELPNSSKQILTLNLRVRLNLMTPLHHSSPTETQNRLSSVQTPLPLICDLSQKSPHCAHNNLRHPSSFPTRRVISHPSIHLSPLPNSLQP